MRTFRVPYGFALAAALAVLLSLVPTAAVATSAAAATVSASPQESTPVREATLASAVAVDPAELIRARIEYEGGRTPVIAVRGERLHAAEALPRFYERRAFQPAWTGSGGGLPLADSLVRALARAEREGLRSDDYHLPRVRALLADLRSARRSGSTLPAAQLADLDLLLTDAFLLYGSHLVSGRVDPVAMHPEWTAQGREADLLAVLETALATSRVAAGLESLLPEHPEYFRLRATLERYRRIADDGGLPEIPGRPLHPGETHAAVAVVREWARLTGDLSPGAVEAGDRESGDPERFDPELEAAVRRLQERHALVPTGVVTLETSALMNVPIEQRIRDLELNLERWRWLPRELGERHVRVNIAGLDVRVVEGDSVTFASRVMVGAQLRETPVFSDRMTYLVLNPSWTIPPGILEQDKLPLIRRNPGYLRANRIRVLDASGNQVEPGSVDWSKVTGRTSYRFRMDPGPENPLGQVKFMFPNAHFIYLHDTPTRELFDRARRDFSSGCIRVERPLELAAHLLRDDSRWTRERIEAALRSPGEQTVSLKRAVPVHLLYWTAWAEPDGAVHFREDIYDRDSALDEALRTPPPGVPAPTAALP